MKKQKVLVGLSGGVDSAVTAHLLLQQGYEVIAGFMKNYAEPDNPNCTTRQDRDSALKVAAHLGIKTFIIFDFRTEYQERIIDYIYAGYKQGLTPNPDVFCNNLIKFDLFLEQALSLGCDYVATGHYARVRRLQDGAEDKGNSGTTIQCLLKGLDETKDQSYFLSRLSQHQLSHALFPLGELTKTQVRQIAHDIKLPNADRPDSQGLCFIGDVPMSEFLRKKLPETEGNIIDQTGKKVGIHKGARFYTLGQRHQLFLPFKAYVTAIDVKNNIVTVGDKDDEKLISDRVLVTDRVWTGDVIDEDVLSSCLVKIRYRQNPAISAALITSYNSEEMTFAIPETRGVTPGQVLVAYTVDDQVIGSGVIM